MADQSKSCLGKQGLSAAGQGRAGAMGPPEVCVERSNLSGCQDQLRRPLKTENRAGVARQTPALRKGEGELLEGIVSERRHHDLFVGIRTVRGHAKARDQQSRECVAFNIFVLCAERGAAELALVHVLPEPDRDFLKSAAYSPYRLVRRVDRWRRPDPRPDFRRNSPHH